MISTRQYSEVESPPSADRRRLPRLASVNLQVLVRQRGRFRRTRAIAVDFNRHGIALLSRAALRSNVPLIVELGHHDLASRMKVMGIVHNCVPFEDGFRCGIRFRPQSRYQFDTEQTEAYLLTLEQALMLEQRTPSA